MKAPMEDVENFDGHVAHMTDGGKESAFFLYVAPVTCGEVRKKMEEVLSASLDSIKPVAETDSLNNGSVYLVRDDEKMDRAWLIKAKENDNIVQIALMDKGCVQEMERRALLCCPAEMCSIGVFGVMCPVLIANATPQLRTVAQKLSGRKCRCITDEVVTETCSMPYVKGRVLIEYESGGFAELKDIALEPIQGKECAKFEIECGGSPTEEKSSILFNDPVREDRSPIQDSWNTAGCGFNSLGNNRTSPNDVFKRSSGNQPRPGNMESTKEREPSNETFKRDPSEHSFVDGSMPRQQRSFRGHTRNGHSSPAFRNRSGVEGKGFISSVGPSRSRDDFEMQREETVPMITGSVFKEFEPNWYPKLIRVRYVKQDRDLPLARFWMVDPSLFTTIERVLYEGRDRYGELGTMERTQLDELVGCGFLVRASVDDGSRCLCRAIVSNCSQRTSRVCVYLIDFGVFKSVRAVDLLDLSTLSKNDPALSVDVSMFLCQLQRPAFNVGELMKGREYELSIISKGEDGVFLVNITAGTSNGLSGGQTHSATASTTNEVEPNLNGDTIMQTLTNFFATQLEVNSNPNISSQSAMSNFAAFAPQTCAMPGYGMPYMIPVAVPIPVPANTLNEAQQPTGMQAFQVNESVHSEEIRARQSESDHNAITHDNARFSNRGAQWNRGGRTGGSRGHHPRSFGRGSSDDQTFRKFGSVERFDSKQRDFDTGKRRGADFWNSGDASVKGQNLFARNDDFDQSDKARPSFLKRNESTGKAVSSAWDIPTSRQVEEVMDGGAKGLDPDSAER